MLSVHEVPVAVTSQISWTEPGMVNQIKPFSSKFFFSPQKNIVVTWQVVWDIDYNTTPKEKGLEFS